MDMSQYLEIFIEETKEHLQGLNQCLLQLEKNPEDKPMLNEIFRVSHTLKGMSGTMGYNKMLHLTHDMENVLHAIRSDELKVNSNLIDLLFKCLDALENYLNNIINSGNEGAIDYNDIIQALGNIMQKNQIDIEASETKSIPIQEETIVESVHPTANFTLNQYEQNIISKAQEMKMNAYQITIVLNKGCVLKSARSFIIFQSLERYSEIIRSQPNVEDIEDEKFDFEFTVILVSKEDGELFTKELNSIAEVEDVIIKPIELNSSIDVQPANYSGELKSDIEKIFVDSEELDIEKEDTDKMKAAPGVSKQKTGKTVRVDIDRLDVLMNLVSELIIVKTRLEGLDGGERSQRYNEAVEYLERITTSLHDAVMKVRMVPVEAVFNRFPRMIRDISRDLKKEIILDMSGEETELDRTVIDEIGDPLIHLLRNSADHGIEPAGKRKELGKTEEGHIFLRAYQDGNNVVIEVEDDGQGINIAKVKKKAIENGLVSKEIAKNLAKKDIIDFLFRPSFSTIDVVTDLSGRGVGLDVVKTKIEALGGIVEVESEMGKGTKFIIRMPLTLAIIQALLVNIGSEKYAIPLNSIKEIINITPEQIKLVQKQEVILIRQSVVPIVRLDKILEVPKDSEVQKKLTVVVVRKGEKLSGFIVDNLIGQQEIVIKSLGKFLSGIKSIAGATILGDGNVALILDVNSLA